MEFIFSLERQCHAPLLIILMSNSVIRTFSLEFFPSNLFVNLGGILINSYYDQVKYGLDLVSFLIIHNQKLDPGGQIWWKTSFLMVLMVYGMIWMNQQYLRYCILLNALSSSLLSCNMVIYACSSGSDKDNAWEQYSWWGSRVRWLPKSLLLPQCIPFSYAFSFSFPHFFI